MEQLGGLGDFDQAAAFSLELLPWVRQNFTLTEICSWESSLAWWLCCLGRYDEAVQLGRSTLDRLADPLLAPSVWSFCVEQLAYALTEATAWDEAEDLLRVARGLGVRASGTVIMDIQVQKVEPAVGLAIEGAAGTPLSTRTAHTKLMVRDGGTSVIAGIYQTKENDARTRLPFVHQIPIIGALFRTHDINTSHDELLIFITPRIVRNL